MIRTRILSTAILFLLLFTTASFGTNVFINEIHYDNDGGDTGEAIEIAGIAGLDLAGWSVVFYNGNGGAPYETLSLSGILSDMQNGFGILSFEIAGIQNGAPDGLALVDPFSKVEQFLSYEGTFKAVGGVADGIVSTDIGVSETGATPVGYSLQLTGSSYLTFSWAVPSESSFGAINSGQSFNTIVAPVPEPSSLLLIALGGLLIFLTIRLKLTFQSLNSIDQ
ncbi:PEP-CTERM sorting domain-containing protein [candidate division KSB1 bacterium]|nr:PEP-CTERM sorting domain-containing protein [candidate division KSB1 bacterium]